MKPHLIVATAAGAPVAPPVLAAGRGPDRLGLHLLFAFGVFLLLVALGGAMRRAWRRRAERREEGLPALPDIPDDPGPVLAAPLKGLYLGTVDAGGWLERITARGLGGRADAYIGVYENGVRVDRTGEEPFWIAREAVRGARLERAHAGKVAGAGRIVVIAWELAGHELETGLRGEDRTRQPKVVRAVHDLIGPPPTPRDGELTNPRPVARAMSRLRPRERGRPAGGRARAHQPVDGPSGPMPAQLGNHRPGLGPASVPGLSPTGPVPVRGRPAADAGGRTDPGRTDPGLTDPGLTAGLGVGPGGPDERDRRGRSRELARRQSAPRALPPAPRAALAPPHTPPQPRALPPAPHHDADPRTEVPRYGVEPRRELEPRRDLDPVADTTPRGFPPPPPGTPRPGMAQPGMAEPGMAERDRPSGPVSRPEAGPWRGPNQLTPGQAGYGQIDPLAYTAPRGYRVPQPARVPWEQPTGQPAGPPSGPGPSQPGGQPPSQPWEQPAGQGPRPFREPGGYPPDGGYPPRPDGGYSTGAYPTGGYPTGGHPADGYPPGPAPAPRGADPRVADPRVADYADDYRGGPDDYGVDPYVDPLTSPLGQVVHRDRYRGEDQ